MATFLSLNPDFFLMQEQVYRPASNMLSVSQLSEATTPRMTPMQFM